jgi:hypothetical protein
MEKKSTPNAQGQVLTEICQSLRRAGSNEPSENHCPCESGKWRAKGPIYPSMGQSPMAPTK